MVVVEMSDDIRKYETKEFGPFTKRELKYVGVGLAVGIIFALIVPASLVTRIVTGLVIFFVIAMCGYVKFGGMYFEVLALKCLYMFVLTPQCRKSKTQNMYRECLNEFDRQEEKKFYQSLSHKEQKKYTKSKNNKKITYSKKPEYKVYR